LAGDVTALVALAAEGSVLAKPGGPRYLLLPLVVLVIYAVAALHLITRADAGATTVLEVGGCLGALTGAMWVISLGVETFAGLSGWANVAATAPMLLGGFALWGLAGGIACRRSHSIGVGIFAAVSAAMMCVAITVAFGFALGLTALPRLEHNIDGSPEFMASHWGDLHAFAIANTLDAALTHLLVAPIVAALTGTVGALTANRLRRPRSSTAAGKIEGPAAC